VINALVALAPEDGLALEPPSEEPSLVVQLGWPSVAAGYAMGDARWQLVPGARLALDTYAVAPTFDVGWRIYDGSIYDLRLLLETDLPVYFRRPVAMGLGTGLTAQNVFDYGRLAWMVGPSIHTAFTAVGEVAGRLDAALEAGMGLRFGRTRWWLLGRLGYTLSGPGGGVADAGLQLGITLTF
jgi:hypothetical protein